MEMNLWFIDANIRGNLFYLKRKQIVKCLYLTNRKQLQKVVPMN